MLLGTFSLDVESLRREPRRACDLIELYLVRVSNQFFSDI